MFTKYRISKMFISRIYKELNKKTQQLYKKKWEKKVKRQSQPSLIIR